MAGERVKITNDKDLERWLEGRDRGDAAVIAARAALRAIPGLAENPRSDIVLPCFRAMAAPWVAATCSTQGAEAQLVEAAHSAARSARSAHSAAASAADSAYSAALSAASALSAALSADSAYSAALSAARRAVEADVNAIGGDTVGPTVGSAPLWPINAYEQFAELWSELKNILLVREGENWQAWTDWYEARLRGDPVNCELERARVLELTEEDWADPARANAKLAKIEARFATDGEREDAPADDGLPGDGDPAPPEDTDNRPPELETDETAALEASVEQRPAAYGFALRDGRITGQAQTVDPFQPELLNDMLGELLDKAIAHREAVESHRQSPQRVMRTAKSIEALLTGWDAAPKPGVLWMRRNALLGDMVEFNSAAGREELPPGALAEMADLAQSILDTLSLYPSVQALVARATALDLKPGEADAVEAELNALTEAAKASDVVDESAVDALQDGAEDVRDAQQTEQTALDPDRRAKAVERKMELTGQRVLSARNFWAELLRAGQDGAIEGARGGAKLTVQGGIIALIGVVTTPLVAVAAAIPALAPIRGRAQALLASRNTNEADSDQDNGDIE